MRRKIYGIIYSHSDIIYKHKQFYIDLRITSCYGKSYFIILFIYLKYPGPHSYSMKQTQKPLWAFCLGKLSLIIVTYNAKSRNTYPKPEKKLPLFTFIHFIEHFLSTYAWVCVVTIFVKYNPRNSLDFYRSKGNYASIAIVKFGLQVCAMNIRYMSYPMINRKSVDNVG